MRIGEEKLDLVCTMAPRLQQRAGDRSYVVAVLKE